MRFDNLPLGKTVKEGNDYALNIYTRLDNETVEVETLYRFGKPSKRTKTRQEFDDWQKHCEKV